MTTHTKKCSICPETELIIDSECFCALDSCISCQVIMANAAAVDAAAVTKPTKKKIVFKIKHLAAITQDVWINSKSYITNPDDIVEMASTNQALINDVGRQLNELKNELEMDDDDDIHICGETGKQYDTDPNPKLGCGIRCDDENGMIGNISYCIGCMEK